MSIDWIDWDNEAQRAILLDALECYADTLPPTEPLKPLAPAPLGLASDPISKIEPAPLPFPPELLTPLYRPELSAPNIDPNRNIMYDLFEVHKKTEEQASRGTKILKWQIDSDMADIERLTLEKQQALEKHAKEVKTKNTWGILGKIAQYITSAATIVFGIACIATGVGSAAGALLIASGGLGLASRVMTDTGAWHAVVKWFTKSEELQLKLAQRIDMGLFFLSLGLGLAGGILALHSGAFAALRGVGPEAIAQKASQILALAGGTSTAVTRVGEAASDNKVKKLDALLKLDEGGIFLDYEKMNENTKSSVRMVETSTSILDVIKEAISSRVVTFD